MVVDLTNSLYLPSGLFHGTVIENQSPDLLFAVVCQAGRKLQIAPGKQIQDYAPGYLLISQHVVVWILATLLFYLLPILTGEIAVDVPAAVKQHHKQCGHNFGYHDPALLNRIKLSKYAPYVKEPYRIFQAQACFAIVVQEFLKFTQIIRNFRVLHVVFVV
jgi:hypothetical protein